VAFDGARTLVGLGFGAIQSGLFVYEADRSEAYAPPLVIDVRADLVAGLRADEGRFRVNIARADRVDVVDIGPINVADSSVEAERPGIIEAIAAADEFASALPSVAFYRTDGPNSPHQLLAEGLRRRTRPEPLIVFCAENHRSAAELLEAAVLAAVPDDERERVAGRARYLDTVIGKMSGVITDETELRANALVTITSALPQAFLVEEFDRILVSRVGGGLHPGMPVLREVDDLAPFEDAKLLGHNATHALAGFLGALLDLTLVAELAHVEGAMGFLRSAFIEESGVTLRRRWEGADELFSEFGYAAFADDLLERMVNPWLADTIERAGRDPRRKLGWDDRLVGLIRVGLAEGVPTPRYAMGVAAGLDVLRQAGTDHGYDADLLRGAWPDGIDAAEVDAVLAAVNDGREWLDRWRAGGFTAVAEAG
jgi:mannitol-1-phosphate 5-dehydrogenase